MKRAFIGLVIGALGCSGQGGVDITAQEAGAEDRDRVPQQDAAESAPDAASDAKAQPADASLGGVPPFGGSSSGKGGKVPVSGDVQQVSGITYRLVVPGSYANKPTPLLVVFSGVEGGAAMTNNLLTLGPQTGIDSFVCAVLDGKVYNNNGGAGATALDDVRAHYDIDNDRTYLLSESAGTRSGLALGFQLRQSYFAAFWANDVNFSGSPAQSAQALGFAPWGQAGPGGQFAIAGQIVQGMKVAGYRLPNPAPYAGPGASMHGSVPQFIAALSWLPGKTR